MKFARTNISILVFLLCFSMNSVFCNRSEAMSSDVRTVLTTGVYGIVGGTVLGLAAYPFTRSTRGIFIGTAIGLYFGLAAGIYHINNRDNPENPFNSESNFELYDPNLLCENAYNVDLSQIELNVPILNF